jgi:hypothetical protein
MEERWSDQGLSVRLPEPVPVGSFRFRAIPAADRRLSETDNRPMLDPRDGLGEAVLGFTGAGTVPGEGGTLRCGRDEDDEDDRDGGREFRSGDMVKEEAEFAIVRVELQEAPMLSRGGMTGC